jgi:hypothetical protein
MLTKLKIRPTPADDIDMALELVVDLAFQNVIDRLDNPSEYRRQTAAVKLVRETFLKPGGLT